MYDSLTTPTRHGGVHERTLVLPLRRQASVNKCRAATDELKAAAATYEWLFCVCTPLSQTLGEQLDFWLLKSFGSQRTEKHSDTQQKDTPPPQKSLELTLSPSNIANKSKEC